ncbi:MAG: ABC transporter ATP-binding protein [Syntrophales bacterium]|jgi:branched-chain amino acid transport system ATP-binding protein
MLRIDGISKRFGGLNVLQDVSFSIESGRIIGIIGPNGAGKTTLFNIITGIYQPTSGGIFFEGNNTTGYHPEKLAKLGMVRTFQGIELFGQMSVLENVMVGLHTKSSSGFVASAFKLPGHLKEERSIRARAQYWLEFAGMEDLMNITACNLPFGKGRLLEIARAMALEPKIILMDEPAAGLNSRETIDLAVLIRKITDLGVTIALVEHDMELVMDICEKIVVLNIGRKLAEGTSREIQENEKVIAAYLGEE